MKWLSIFRAPETAFWATAVVALAVGVPALHYAGERALADPEVHAAIGKPAVRTATQSVAGEAVRNLAALMPAGLSAGTDPEALAAWGTSVAQVAVTGSQARAEEGAPASDDLRASLATVGSLGEQMVRVADDKVAAAATRTQVSLQVSRLLALVAGQPAPALPQGATDLWGAGHGELQVPQPHKPAKPSAPNLD